jgi:hypothetical protein
MVEIQGVNLVSNTKLFNMDYITPLKEKLDENLHTICGLFKVIGTPAETPRYFNFKEFDMDTRVLKIGSTQRDSLYFSIQTEFTFVDCDEFWNQFKQYRTEFLKTNYPTINPY